MQSPIYQQIADEVKTAMKARNKQRLGALRLIMAEFKRVEVDERVALDDTRVLSILDKMTKQRKDSLAQYEAAGRDDLAGREAAEIAIIAEFLPQALTDDEIKTLVADAIAQSGAVSMQDMGKVMGLLKPKVQGRADMGAISGMVKAQLAG